MSESGSSSSGGVGVVSLLGILFIGLKLTGYITWSWLWVLSPFWIGLALMLFLIISFGIFVGIVYYWGKIKSFNKNKK